MKRWQGIDLKDSNQTFNHTSFGCCAKACLNAASAFVRSALSGDNNARRRERMSDMVCAKFEDGTRSDERGRIAAER